MKKGNCVISIKGMQTYCDELTDSTDVKMMAEGDFSESDGKYFVVYDETEATGMEGTKTTLEICDEYVSLTREGKVETTLLFIKGRQTTSYYDTPFGTIVMGISTDDIANSVDANGGNVSVKYGISLNNVFTGTNTFDVNIRKI
ncbi:MAG: DUF1934 domain-containing protein [Ruminococcaceae bacterium]|nr:DUF1934 domain-containing protein [Oscillospiraceae bacterium]